MYFLKRKFLLLDFNFILINFTGDTIVSSGHIYLFMHLFFYPRLLSLLKFKTDKKNV